MKYTVLLFYKYVGIQDTQALYEREMAVCKVLGLKGRIIIAKEGINGTVEGETDAIEKYKVHIRSDKRFRMMDIKESIGDGLAFPRLSIKIRDEIVATQFPSHIDPRKKTGKYIPAHELKRMYDNHEEFVIVDMRNEYEIASGYFDKTVSAGLNASRDLMAKVEGLRIHQNKKVVTVCTGGVRCEKMSAYLLDQGFTNVHQLHGGMHSFMEKYPGEHYKGTLFTFDNRITMNWGDSATALREIVGECVLCKVKNERYENCKNTFCNKKMLVCEKCSTERGEGVRCVGC